MLFYGFNFHLDLIGFNLNVFCAVMNRLSCFVKALSYQIEVRGGG